MTLIHIYKTMPRFFSNSVLAFFLAHILYVRKLFPQLSRTPFHDGHGEHTQRNIFPCAFLSNRTMSFPSMAVLFDSYPSIIAPISPSLKFGCLVRWFDGGIRILYILKDIKMHDYTRVETNRKLFIENTLVQNADALANKNWMSKRHHMMAGMAYRYFPMIQNHLHEHIS